ncbi:unnamed protein product [Camellia sinensis]
MDSCSSRRRLIPEASRGLRVLLVDEDTSSLRDIASVLDEQFYKVTTIESASVALSMIQGADQFDLVMADTNMRGMDVFTFLSGILLKTDMPVIFMSSNDNMDMARKALVEGACFFFQKPIREQDLINVWQHVYRKRASQEIENQKEEKDSHGRKIVKSDSTCILARNDCHGNGNGQLPIHKKKGNDQNKNCLLDGNCVQESQDTCKEQMMTVEKVKQGESNIIQGIKIMERDYCSGKIELMGLGLVQGDHAKESLCTTQTKDRGKDKQGTSNRERGDLKRRNSKGLKSIEDDCRGMKNTGNSNTKKKSRMKWTPALHLKFMDAICAVGEREPHPQTIQRMMNEPNLTARHIASHLQVGDSSEIIEEQPICQQQRQNIALEIPSRTNEGSTEDFVRINIPLTPNRTPKRVNFSPIPSPSYYRFNDSPSPLSTRAKSSMKSLFPKLSFKFRNTTSEIERAAILALGDSPADTWEKPLIRRTLSLSKLFTPKMKRTSSLPVTPIAHSNPESMHGGNTIDDYVVSLLTENGNTKDDLRLATDDALFTQNTEQQVQGVLNLIDLAGSERLSRSNWGPTERDSDCTSSNSDFPISHASQLSNPFLSLPLESGKCESCGAAEPGTCEGHFGYIELPIPVNHPSHVSELKRLLSLNKREYNRRKYKERVMRINSATDDSPIHQTNMIEEASYFPGKSGFDGQNSMVNSQVPDSKIGAVAMQFTSPVPMPNPGLNVGTSAHYDLHKLRHSFFYKNLIENARSSFPNNFNGVQVANNGGLHGFNNSGVAIGPFSNAFNLSSSANLMDKQSHGFDVNLQDVCQQAPIQEWNPSPSNLQNTNQFPLVAVPELTQERNFSQGLMTDSTSSGNASMSFVDILKLLEEDDEFEMFNGETIKEEDINRYIEWLSTPSDTDHHLHK